jgi:hypothetical protein
MTMESRSAKNALQVLTQITPTTAVKAVLSDQYQRHMEQRNARSVLSDRHRQLVHRHAHPARKVLTPLRPDQCAHHAQQGRMLIKRDHQLVHHAQQGRPVRLDRRHVQSVVLERHRQVVHRRAHPVRKVLTPLLPDQCAHHAQLGRTRVLLDQRSAQLVVKDRYQHLAHRHAHHVRQAPTPLRPAHVANHAQQGRTVRLDQRSAHLVLEDHHQHLGHRPAQNNMFIE